MAFWLSAALLVLTLGIAAEVLRGWRRLRRLSEILPRPADELPSVSIVVAALNEAHTIEPALRSAAALDYPALEIVAVDDRSTDGTGEILERLARELPSVQVIHVEELPAGWLGKNHALHRGAERARGEYLLFTDADVVYAPSALRRAVAHCEAGRLDHLTIVPDFPMRSAFLRFAMLAGIVGLLALYRPWRAQESGRHGLGIGAFNLVRARSYREAGGHAAMPMEVLDDIELGRRMGRRHFRQDLLLGSGMLSVEMYRSAREMFRGLQKNAFTFLDYRAATLVAATLATFALGVWPWLGIFVTDGAARLLNALTALALVATYWQLAPRFGYGRSCLAYLPLHGLLTIAIFWQVALLAWCRGGIEWRGTRYRLSELKAARRRSRVDAQRRLWRS